ncbi:MAG: ribonuclease HII [Candidatus Heimdallarchaeota archaeon]|nr:ribonuclease HII [Candidatus Heimdallarchaeota archaeon]
MSRFEILEMVNRGSKANTLTIGMDEAGRGPVMGPLIIGLCVTTPHQNKALTNKGVMDSKKLTKKRREELFSYISKYVVGYGILKIPASEIDRLRLKEVTLNEIEVQGFKTLLKSFNLKNEELELQLDAADVNAQRFGDQFSKIFQGKIDSRHKGDSIFPSVSAASILAKVTRDKEMEKIASSMKKFDPMLPKVGSGYPNKISKEFLSQYFMKYQRYPAFVRTTWETAEKIRLEYELKQTSLDDYF